MGPTADARAELADLLEPVWPGRVRTYRVTQPRPAAGIYIGELSAGWETGELGGQAWTATFAVQLVGDGAPHAAAAMLDDLLDQCYRAVARSERFYPDAVTWSPFGVDASVELPGYLFTVQVAIDVRTWCATDPAEPVTLPPQPVGV
jgi:hypothetical protein